MVQPLSCMCCWAAGQAVPNHGWIVQALNDREMPTAGSMLEAFNQQLVMQCGEGHATALAAIHLPIDAVQVPRKPVLFLLVVIVFDGTTDDVLWFS